MAADRGNFAYGDPGAGEQPAYGARIEVGQFIGEKGGAMQLVARGLLQCEQSRTQPRRVWQMDVFHEPELLAARDGEDCVNAVEAGARHYSDVEI
jgi:hypothetical protein